MSDRALRPATTNAIPKAYAGASGLRIRSNGSESTPPQNGKGQWEAVLRCQEQLSSPFIDPQVDSRRFPIVGLGHNVRPAIFIEVAHLAFMDAESSGDHCL